MVSSLLLLVLLGLEAKGLLDFQRACYKVAPSPGHTRCRLKCFGHLAVVTLVPGWWARNSWFRSFPVPTPSTSSKYCHTNGRRTAVQMGMGGVLQYKCGEAYYSTNVRCTVGFPFLQGFKARKVEQYKWGRIAVQHTN